MATAPKRRYTPEEYLELERAAPYKSEYLEGEIYAMVGGSEHHNIITLNIGSALHNQFRGRPCRAYTNDMRVQVSTTGLYTYPDVIAVCGPRQLADRHNDTLLNPTVIIEVLSPSTEAYDRGEKFAHYRRLETLTDYVLVAQNQVRVEHFVRQNDGWLLSEANNLEDNVRIESINCTLTLAEIYDNVEFPDPPARHRGTNPARPIFA